MAYKPLDQLARELEKQAQGQQTRVQTPAQGQQTRAQTPAQPQQTRAQTPAQGQQTRAQTPAQPARTFRGDEQVMDPFAHQTPARPQTQTPARTQTQTPARPQTQPPAPKPVKKQTPRPQIPDPAPAGNRDLSGGLLGSPDGGLQGMPAGRSVPGKPAQQDPVSGTQTGGILSGVQTGGGLPGMRTGGGLPGSGRLSLPKLPFSAVDAVGILITGFLVVMLILHWDEILLSTARIIVSLTDGLLGILLLVGLGVIGMNLFRRRFGGRRRR